MTPSALSLIFVMVSAASMRSLYLSPTIVRRSSLLRSMSTVRERENVAISSTVLVWKRCSGESSTLEAGLDVWASMAPGGSTAVPLRGGIERGTLKGVLWQELDNLADFDAVPESCNL